MKFVTHISTVAAMAIASILAPASAEAAVTYTFNSYTTHSFGTTTGSFSYVAPTFITSNTSIPTPANCTVTAPPGVSCGTNQYFYPDASGFTGANADAIGFTLGINQHFFYFPDGALGAYGTYSSFVLDDQAGQLVVANIPEPASWALLLLGLGAIGTTRRRRRTSAIPKYA